MCLCGSYKLSVGLKAPKRKGAHAEKGCGAERTSNLLSRKAIVRACLSKGGPFTPRNARREGKRYPPGTRGQKTKQKKRQLLADRFTTIYNREADGKSGVRG